MLSTLLRVIAPLAAAASISLGATFGPPHITVRRVTDLATAPTGAVLLVDGDHHSEVDLLTITGRAEGLVNGKRISQPLQLVRASAGHYSLTKQWQGGTPWVLVLEVQQGVGGTHGVAEAIVKVDAAGAVVSIDYPAAGWIGKDNTPKRTAASDIDAMLATLVAKR